MPDTKLEALRKLNQAYDAIRQAEAVLVSVTTEDLEAAGYPNHLAEVPKADKAHNKIYDVYAHATALKIVRQHLWMEFLA